MSDKRSSHLVFSIYDTKAESWSQPFVQTTVGLGLRFFENLVTDPQTSLHKYPEDYTLFRLGKWDEREATMEMEAAPVALAKALEYAKDKPIQ